MTTPEDPFAKPPGDQPAGGPPPGYGQPAYPPAAGQPGYGQPSNQPGGPQLAEWSDRALGGVIDWFGPNLVAFFVSFAISNALGSLLSLAALGWFLYNAYLGGATGQSYGKKIAGTRLLLEQDGQLIGGGMGIGRALLHIVDAIPCYVGFLWPLWDDKKQTFADKILKTVVVKV